MRARIDHVAALQRRMAALERRLEAAESQSRTALRVADFARSKAKVASPASVLIRTMALAGIRPAVIARAMGLSPGNVSQQINLARMNGIAIPRFPPCRLAVRPDEIAHARRMAGLDVVPDGFVPPPFQRRRAMAAMLRAGRPDALFVALCRHHPHGPPFEVLPPVDDGRPMRDLRRAMPDVLSSCGSPAALAMEG